MERIKQSEEGGSILGEQWNMEDVEFAGNKQVEDEQNELNNGQEKDHEPRNFRQERKMAMMLLSVAIDDDEGVSNAIDAHDIDEKEIDYDSLRCGIDIGTINDDIAGKIIKSLELPRISRVLDKLSNDELGILNHFDTSRLGTSLEQRVANFYIDYPSPFELAEEEKGALIEGDPERKKKEERSKRFRDLMYDKREKYYMAYQNLKQDALEQVGDDEPFNIRRLNEREQDEILKKSMPEDNEKRSFWFNLRNRNTKTSPLPNNIEILKGFGLVPETQVEFGKTKVNLSPMFDCNDRPSVIAYVEAGDGSVNACTYYRSKSQDMWRLLPDYIGSEDGSDIVWHGKAKREESLNLPIELQLALERLSNVGPRIDLGSNDAGMAITRTANRYQDWGDYGASEKKGPFWQEVSQRPVATLDMDELDYSGIMQRDSEIWPDEIGPDSSAWPDFSKPVYESKTKSDLYGDVVTKRFFSHDGDYLYTIKTDSEGRAWLGSVEKLNSPITSTGLRRDYVFLGRAGTPAFEYGGQIPNKGDAGDKRGSYSDARSYVKGIPIIRAYFDSQRKEAS